MKRSEWHFKRTLVIAASAAAVAFLAVGCGKHEERAATGSSGEPTAGISEATPVATQGASAVVASTNAGATAAEPVAEEKGTSPADSLPPDIVVVEPEGMLLPGAVAEILAQGSPDVEAVTLTDGLGKQTSFAYDSESALWRVAYRVPVRNAADRVALSVTARDGANRWKRVWVFLKVPTEQTEAAAKADSAR
jgi:hypothetical protein